MELPQLNISLEALAESVSERALEELKPRNPKFKIGEKLKFKIGMTFIEKDTGNEKDYINIKIKDIKYSPTLEDNIYVVIILDTIGQIEDYTTEKDLIKQIKKEVD